METFSIRDLRERTGELVSRALVYRRQARATAVRRRADGRTPPERGGRGRPRDPPLRREGVSLGKATKLARISTEEFIARLGAPGIPAVDYPPEEIDEELAAIGADNL
jgi:hypothetical protein